MKKKYFFNILTIVCIVIVSYKSNGQTNKKTTKNNLLISFNKKFKTTYTFIKEVNSTYFIFSSDNKNKTLMRYGVIDTNNNKIYKPIFKKIEYNKNVFFFLKNNTLTNSKNKKIDNIIDFYLYRNEVIIQKKNNMYYLCDQNFSYIMSNFTDLNHLKQIRSIMNTKNKKSKIDSFKLTKKNNIAKEESKKRIMKLLNPILKNEKFNFKIVQDTKKFSINDINQTIVMGVSSWSGHTYVIGSKILNGISESKKNKISLIILDYDFAYDKKTEKIFRSRHWKYPVACWIENSKIAIRAEKQQELESFIKYVKEKLN